MTFLGYLWRVLTAARADRVLPVLIVLLAAVVRIHWIDHQSLWNDEGNTLRLIERTIPDLLSAATRDIHPPGYYLVLKAWAALTGDSEFALRAFSALAGVVTVAAVYALGRALFMPGVGMVAAFLTALHGFSVYYGQEARMYALVALLAALSMWAYVCWAKRLSGGGPLRRWVTVESVTLGLVNAAGLYTHYSFPAVIAVQAILTAVLAFQARQFATKRVAFDTTVISRFIGSNLITLILFLPQLGVALGQIGGWGRGAGADGLAMAVRWLIYGNTFDDGGNGWVYAWPLLFGLVGLLPDWLRGRGAPGSGWRRLLLILWLVVPVAGLFAAGLSREAYLKFLLPAQIPLTLLIGRGVWWLWEIGAPFNVFTVEVLPRLAAVFGLLAIIGFQQDTLDNLYAGPAYQRDDYRRIARVIDQESRPGDAIILNAPNQREVFTYYYQGQTPIYGIPAGLGGDDAAAIDQTRQVIASARRIFVVYWGEAERDPNRVVEKTLAAEAFEVRSGWYGDLRFVTYGVMPHIGRAEPIGARFGGSITLVAAALSAGSQAIRAGDVLGVALTWATDAHIDKRYRVTVQLLDDAGRLVAQRDAEPGNDMALTTTWAPGQPVEDLHGLLIPITAPPGQYTVHVALYELDDPSVRLPVRDGTTALIATIQVAP
jgi:hypothetical protein